MMRPMKLAGSELMFGEGSLAYIKTIKAKKVSIVIGGHSMEKSGMLAKVEGYFKETGAETMVIRGVEPDPSFETVLRGRNEMLEFEPDLIVGLGGGSAMDAAKAMWIFYEHPELTQMEVFTQFSSDLDAATKEQLEYGSGLMELLKQPLGHPMSMHEMVITLCAARNKVFLGIPVKEVKKFQMDMLNYFATVHPEISEEIEQTKALSDELAAKIVETAKEFKDSRC